MRSERVAIGETRRVVRPLHARTPQPAAPGEADKIVSARLSLSSTSLARLLSVSGGAPDWILSSIDGSTTVKVRLAVSGVPDAAVAIGKGDVELDFSRSLLCYKGRQVTLTRMELRLLGALLEHAPDAVPRAQLISRLWPSSRSCREAEGALAVWVCALRRRLGALGIAEGIRTVRGTGYSLTL